MAERHPPAFRNLLAYQIASTSDALRRSAALCMRREYDLSLSQVRALILIDHLQPARLRDVAADAGADKAQISRVVSSLVSRGLISRRALSGDARSAHLELTPHGSEKIASVMATLVERDRTLQSALGPGELEPLLAALTRVRKSADQLTIEEERLSATAMAPARA